MRLRDFLAIAAIATLLAMIATPAQTQTNAGPGVMTHVVRGTIISLDAQRLVIKQRGKAQKEMSFVLDRETGKPGNLSVGDDVTVRYRTEKQQNIATGVQYVRRNKS
jgi:hypothetical protein